MIQELLFEFKCASQVALKDLRMELRNKHEISSMLIFGTISILVFSFSIGPFPKYVNEFVPAIIWMVLLFTGTFGFSTIFLRESDQGTIDGLRLLPVSPQAVLIGKVLYGFSLMAIIEVIIIPTSMVLFNFSFNSSCFLVIIVFFLGTLGLALIGTMVSGLAMYSESRAILIPMLMLPMVLPIIIPCVILTRAMALGSTFASAMPELKIIILSLIALFTASIILFEYLFAD